MSARPETIIRDEILRMSAYAVPSSTGMIKLDAMENPYALPEALRQEIGALVTASEINRYPDPSAPDLKRRLRAVMGINKAYDILLGNGSDELIQIMIQACARPGATIMAPAPTFAMYRQYAVIAGLKYVGVPLAPDFSLDLERFLAAMREHRPAIVFVSYPNNPTGNLFPADAVARILEEAPGLVVVDEAYQPFADGTFMTRLPDHQNLVMLRTVSKLGLAGIRLGYAVARPEWVAEFNKVRSPYNVNVLTQLVAERVLAHNDVLQEQAVAIREERAKLAAALGRMAGVTPFPSQANFILARVPDARLVFEELRQRGILIKNLHEMHPLLDQCVRFTVGTPIENASLIASLEAILSARGAVTADRVG